MPLIYRSGDLLQDTARVLVNPVNTVGVMGKGLALAFRTRFPMLDAPYRLACQTGALRLGTVQFLPIPDGRLVANFPTKEDWRKPSQVSWVRDGLVALVRGLVIRAISTVAVPPLGCGNGGLHWTEVEPVILEAFARVPSMTVHLYAGR